jgi:hypothetical protein
MDFAIKNWADLAALSTSLQFFVILGAAIFALGQFREADRNRRLVAMVELFRLIGDEDMRVLRSWLLHDMPLAGSIIDVDRGLVLDEGALERIRKLSVTYDRVGYMIAEGVLPLTSLLDFQRDEIERLWHRVRPFVEFIREKQHRPNYCKHFEHLAKKAFEHGYGGGSGN